MLTVNCQSAQKKVGSSLSHTHTHTHTPHAHTNTHADGKLLCELQQVAARHNGHTHTQCV